MRCHRASSSLPTTVPGNVTRSPSSLRARARATPSATAGCASAGPAKVARQGRSRSAARAGMSTAWFFTAVSAGPIDRVKRFCGDIAAAPGREAYLELLRQGVWKLAGGAFGGILLGGLLQAYWLAPLPERGLGATLSYMYGYTLFLFCNFAGYSSMAIGTGYLLGVQVPENFRQPFLSVDMKEFWSRWHSTLSTWLRDYVYSRFVLRSLKQRRFRNPRTASYLGYLLTMLAMGLWHGLAPRYLAYGAYHSALMCLNEALDLHWKPFKKLKKQGAGQLCCALVTFHLFAFGLLIFSGRLF